MRRLDAEHAKRATDAMVILLVHGRIVDQGARLGLFQIRSCCFFISVICSGSPCYRSLCVALPGVGDDASGRDPPRDTLTSAVVALTGLIKRRRAPDFTTSSSFPFPCGHQNGGSSTPRRRRRPEGHRPRRSSCRCRTATGGDDAGETMGGAGLLIHELGCFRHGGRPLHREALTLPDAQPEHHHVLAAAAPRVGLRRGYQPADDIAHELLLRVKRRGHAGAVAGAGRTGRRCPLRAARTSDSGVLFRGLGGASMRTLRRPGGAATGGCGRGAEDATGADCDGLVPSTALRRLATRDGAELELLPLSTWDCYSTTWRARSSSSSSEF